MNARIVLPALTCLVLGFAAGWALRPDGDGERRADERRPGAVEVETPRSKAAAREDLSDDDLKEKLEEFDARSAALKKASAERDRHLEEAAAWLRQLNPGAFEGLTVEELVYMRELDLSSMDVKDEDLKMLQHLPSLRVLTLRRTQVGDDGLVHLQKVQKLQRLGLRETKVTDAGMRHIPGMRSLTHLDLNLNPITDAGIAHIRGMDKLEFLRLNYTKITDEGLSYLTKLGSLQRLDLWALDISDKGMEHLWYLPSLTHLEFGATSISKEWHDRFQAAHPKCYVRSRWAR